jgi:hypothetical protein
MSHYSRIFEIDTEINYEQIKFKIIFMVTPCINDIKHFYCPTNAHNFKKVELLKHFLKIKEAAPTCFGLQ